MAKQPTKSEPPEQPSAVVFLKFLRAFYTAPSFDRGGDDDTRFENFEVSIDAASHVLQLYALTQTAEGAAVAREKLSAIRVCTPGDLYTREARRYNDALIQRRAESKKMYLVSLARESVFVFDALRGADLAAIPAPDFGHAPKFEEVISLSDFSAVIEPSIPTVLNYQGKGYPVQQMTDADFARVSEQHDEAVSTGEDALDEYLTERGGQRYFCGCYALLVQNLASVGGRCDAAGRLDTGKEVTAFCDRLRIPMAPAMAELQAQWHRPGLQAHFFKLPPPPHALSAGPKFCLHPPPPFTPAPLVTPLI